MNQQELTSITDRINTCLAAYSDKDWNYSPIRLEVKPLQILNAPYTLWVDFIDCRTKAGQGELRTLTNEVNWGIRHSSELGILELISLRLNKALLEVSKPEDWQYVWPAVRLMKREQLVEQGIAHALWYSVTEVAGEEFESR